MAEKEAPTKEPQQTFCQKCGEPCGNEPLCFVCKGDPPEEDAAEA